MPIGTPLAPTRTAFYQLQAAQSSEFGCIEPNSTLPPVNDTLHEARRLFHLVDTSSRDSDAIVLYGTFRPTIVEVVPIIQINPHHQFTVITPDLKHVKLPYAAAYRVDQG